VPVPGISVTGVSNTAILLRPVTFAWEEIGVYRLVTMLLAVVGIYFIFWLVQGGAQEIGHWMRTMFKISY
jgi:hypothetical protein